MLLSSANFVLTSTFACLATAATNVAGYNVTTAVPTYVPTYVSPPPPGYTYVVGYPICGVPGFTVVPGNYVETIEASSGSTAKYCLEACKNNETTAAVDGCLSIAFSPNYTECLFFNKVVQETQLYEEKSSYFIHYDFGCEV